MQIIMLCVYAKSKYKQFLWSNSALLTKCPWKNHHNFFRNFVINQFVKPYNLTNYVLFQFQFCKICNLISLPELRFCLVNIEKLRKRTLTINIIKYSLSKQSAHIELAQQDIKTYWTKNSSKQAACTPWFIIKCQGFIGKRIHAII